MSTLISQECSHEHLIEARLDAIERILMDNRVPRRERSEILSSVEEQISELLEGTEGEITRSQVLRVLASLDPPEAYCSDNPRDWPVRGQPAATEVVAGERPAESRAERLRSNLMSPLAIIALVLSLISLPLLIIMPLGSTLALAGGICGVVAISQIAASSGRLRGMWMAIFGCVVFALHSVAVWAILLLQ